MPRIPYAEYVHVFKWNAQILSTREYGSKQQKISLRFMKKTSMIISAMAKIKGDVLANPNCIIITKIV